MKTMFIFIMFMLVMATSVHAGVDIGLYQLPKDRGLIKVKEITGNKMSFDAVFVSMKGELVILMNVYADYDPEKDNAVYSEDRFCPDVLSMTFKNNGTVVIREADCALF